MNATDKKRGLRDDIYRALVVGLGLLLLAAAFNFKRNIHELVGPTFRFPAMELVVNATFAAVAVLLWLMFCRARDAQRRRMELEAIISGISFDTLVVVNPDRVIHMCNESIERVFGYTPREVVGRKTDLLYFDRRSTHGGHEIYDALQRNGYHVGLATGRKKSGAIFPLEIISGDLRGRSGAVLLLRDITERVEAEQQRLAMEARMRRRQKMESMGVLAGGAAHDFNNLLAVIQTHAYLGKQDLAEGSGRTSLEEIEKVVHSATAICRQMLAYAGREEFVVGPVDLSDVMRQTTDLVRRTIPRRHRLHTDLADDAPLINGDATQVQQLVMNLILNASQAIGEDTNGAIRLATGVFNCDQDLLRNASLGEDLAPGRYAFVRVEDTGCGMDPETRERILDPFFTTRESGHGLGLATVQGVLRGHRGALHIESIPGEGSVFMALLPCANDSDSAAP